MRLKCINSGSSGNCYLLQGASETLIIECGVRMREIDKALGWSYEGVSGCLVSHRHEDHSLSLAHLARRGIPVYSHADSFAGQPAEALLFCREVQAMQWTQIGGFRAYPFRLRHASADGEDCPCFGYLIDHAEMGRLLFATDTMMLRYKFPGINHVMLECNYSDEQLEESIEAGLSPAGMRSRLLASHMELQTTKGVLQSNDLSRATEVVLIHLSGRNGEPERFVRECEQASGLPAYIATKGFEMELSIEPY